VKKDEKVSSSESTAGGGNSAGQSGSSSQINSEATKVLLRTVYSQLGTVYANVKTVQEKQIVGSMMTVVNNLIQNPSSPYRDQAGRVIAEYNKLTAEEKKVI
jgi:benzoyl-CoA reductase/2-hydroxyglutaryl-CoA dehydratase subunit BcrC/BadD/HgdB